VYSPWGIGRVASEELPASIAITFGESDWNVCEIQRRFRAAADAFAPDFVVISDTWNMKPHLAEAMRGYPTIWLMQAQECLCPLNNLRLIGIGPAQVEQCPRNQLATPRVCHQCLSERGPHSGALHQVERALAGVGTPEYDLLLRQTLLDAEAVLVLNPVTAAMLEPYARHVRIVPWGIDPARFPWPPPDEEAGAGSSRPPEGKITLFMAAVAGETIKGFHVAHEACRILRETRSDFELVVTFDPPGQIDEITRSVGWRSQDELPQHYRAADIVLVPTIAQDALSITSVEAMAAGRPVVASRIGGLPYTVTDGLTGLLFDPGNPFDLAEKIRRLLDQPGLRRWMGHAGRARFEAEFTWPYVIDRYWRPLLGDPVRR
jgi:glycosyltransferase involved in cell wall biosynthesis